MTPKEARALLDRLEGDAGVWPPVSAVERELWVEQLLPCHPRVVALTVSWCVGRYQARPRLEEFAEALTERQIWWDRQDAIGVVPADDPVDVAGPEVASLALARARAALRGST